jgi:hypothetical protein
MPSAKMAKEKGHAKSKVSKLRKLFTRWRRLAISLDPEQPD